MMMRVGMKRYVLLHIEWWRMRNLRPDPRTRSLSLHIHPRDLHAHAGHLDANTWNLDSNLRHFNGLTGRQNQ